MAHRQMRFQLAHGVEHHADHNQQRSTAEELGHHKRNLEVAVQKHREQRQRHQEDGSARGHARHRTVEEVRRRLSGADARDVRAFLFQVVRNPRRS